MAADTDYLSSDEEGYRRLRRIHEQQLQIREERERELQRSFDERLGLLQKMEEAETQRKRVKRDKMAAKAETSAIASDKVGGASGKATHQPLRPRPDEMLPETVVSDLSASTPLQESVDIPPVANMTTTPARPTSVEPKISRSDIPSSSYSSALMQPPRSLRHVLKQVKDKSGGQFSMEQGEPPFVKQPRVSLEGTVGPPYFPLPILRHKGGKGMYAASVSAVSNKDTVAVDSEDESEGEGVPATVQELDQHKLASFEDADSAYAAKLRQTKQGTPRFASFEDANSAYEASLKRAKQEQLPEVPLGETTDAAVTNDQKTQLVASHEKVTNGGRPLHPEFPSLIRLQCGDYIELRCFVCGGNHSRKHADGTFISGLQGFQRHLSSAHARGHAYDEVLRQCAHKRLPNIDVWAMLQKIPGAYKIEQVIVAAAEPGTAVTKPRQRQSFKKPGQKAKIVPTKRKRKQTKPRPSPQDDETIGELESQEDKDKESDSDDEPVTRKRSSIGRSVESSGQGKEPVKRGH